MQDEEKLILHRRPRILEKAGGRNIKSSNIPYKIIVFTKDLVHTLIEAKWRTLFLILMLTYFGSWTFFGIIYMAIAWIHGDLKFDPITGNRINEIPCIMNAKTFSGFFLMSVESQVSTGYGTWYPSNECSDAITVLIIQLVFGLLIDATIVGIVFQKLIRPPKYSHSEFSKHAVICQRDGKFCLLFRVADFRQTRSIDSKIRAYLFEEARTKEGEYLGKRQQRLKIQDSGRVFMIWPQTVCHVIDENSPLYKYGPMDFIDGRFEIIVGLKGESSYSGHTTQARASYLPHEVLWGYRFLNIVTFDDEAGSFVADVDMMDETERVSMPQCSAKFYDMKKKLKALEEKKLEFLLKNSSK
ncbi:hypothetical protein PVAND_016162 [Polypedilum vanderplanki]|uniref:Inward rectifier potassium channel n=1 Tax=Polypedilum vanderplanki TaxID=319348 RepID=A0A9J6BFD6_POLVA|nr:hypothetical protein PVAND_016162 [Polypedilum vanderplanki]